jgi:hypothetical protein
MALDDLDLEFEDEEEAKKRKNDAVQQDVDLEFHVEDVAQKAKPSPSIPQPPQPPQAPVVERPQASQPMAQVKKIDDARAAQTAKRPGTVAPTARAGIEASTSRSVGANALQSQSQPVMEGHYDFESEEVVQLRERARKAEFDAEVKVQVAEFKTELLSELLSDVKLMDHQINQLLVRINAKHPDMKQEALMIKKILADFTAKKRK